MTGDGEAYVAFDTSKQKNAVAIAVGDRAGEVRYLGEIGNTPEATRKLVLKLAAKYGRLHFCYEAGPTGYGLHRQIVALGHPCMVVAPWLIQDTFYVGTLKGVGRSAGRRSPFGQLMANQRISRW